MDFNEQQLEAINSNAPCILCLAGAGAGKTRVLVTRIARLVSDGADPESILALTFTNAAAFEMKQRYKKLNAETNPSTKCPEFRTFHSFCYSLIIKNKDVREKLGYVQVPNVCSDAEIKKVKSQVVQKLGVKLSQSEIDEGVSSTKEGQRQLDLFNKAFKKELREQNLITFDMICFNVGELFVKDDECIKCYKNKYKYILCDEMQDTDKKQIEFLSSFGKSTNYFLCGDALQNLYSFRGCTNEYIKTLSTAPSWQLIKMYKNYRSTRQICEYANKFSRYAKDSYRIEMEGQRDGDKVETIWGACAGYNTPIDLRHLNMLVKKIQENPVESAVLCRTNKEVNAVGDYLKSAGIDYVRSNKETDAIDILNSALDNEYMKEWLSTFLEGPEYADYIRLSSIRSKEQADIRWFLSLYGNKSKIKERVDKVVNIRKIVSDASSSLEGKLSDIKKILGIKASKEFEIAEGISKRQLIESLRDQLLEDEESKIYIGTIHSSKGLEYERVYVMGVDDKSFELGTEDMNNLFYVAVTRAKNYLTVFRR